MDDKFFDDIMLKGSVLLTASLTPSSEEQLYSMVYKSSKNTVINGVVWVCYQHSPEEVEKKLNSYGIAIPNLQYIDMISQTMGLKREKENVLCCTSPTDYGCLSRSIDEKLDRCGTCLIVIDNLNAMMSYDNMLERFIKALRSLNNRIPQRNSTIIYTAISGACDGQTEVAIQTTMNYVVPINGKVKGKNDIEWQSFKNKSWEEVFSLKAPVLFGMIVLMFAIIIFLSSLLIYLILKLQV
ncbi:MAG: hypothetical protein ABOK23_10275 [Candidatus Methanoperedens sp.]|nr:hypothetical protein [Candidatus Methanoperedens sp.]MCZ7396817.1 hypothetical protein [Candidatus Methanoperedens sp.]